MTKSQIVSLFWSKNNLCNSFSIRELNNIFSWRLQRNEAFLSFYVSAPVQYVVECDSLVIFSSRLARCLVVPMSYRYPSHLRWYCLNSCKHFVCSSYYFQSFRSDIVGRASEVWNFLLKQLRTLAFEWFSQRIAYERRQLFGQLQYRHYFFVKKLCFNIQKSKCSFL